MNESKMRNALEEYAAKNPPGRVHEKDIGTFMKKCKLTRVNLTCNCSNNPNFYVCKCKKFMKNKLAADKYNYQIVCSNCYEVSTFACGMLGLD